MKELISLGLVHPSAKKAFENIDKNQVNRYSFEQRNIFLKEEYEIEFKRNKKAWDFFQLQVTSYKRPAIWWVMSPKQEETRLKRLAILIKDSEAGQKISPLQIGKNNKK
jgi:hypothetical protein